MNDETPKRNPARVFVATALAVVAFCATFAWNPSTPRFYPVERAWHWNEPGQGAAMGWYGRTGAALVASGAVFVAAFGAAASRRNFTLRPGVIYAVAAVVLLSMLATSALIVHEQQPWFTKKSAPPKADHEY